MNIVFQKYPSFSHDYLSHFQDFALRKKSSEEPAITIKKGTQLRYANKERFFHH